jgi:hypothetical protein
MKNKKSLQKLTEIDNLKTVKATKEFFAKNPELKDEIWDSLTSKISESYANDLGNEYKLTNMLVSILEDESVIRDIRNTTYETNHIIITNSIHNHILENRCFPSMATIKESTKLSRQTVYNHLNNGLTDSHNKLIKGKNEIMSMNALSKLYLIGIQDNNPTALKYFIQLSGAVSSNATQINNYIQINNIKISKEDFNRLPKEDIIEIESIVSKTILGK